MEQQENKFNFNGTEYSFDDVSEKAKYIIGHIQELQQEEEKLKRDLDKVGVSSQAFSNLLKLELESSEDSSEEEYEVKEEEA